MATYAVIDIGTNSVKFHIAEKYAEGAWSVVLDETNISRLGEGMQATGTISPEAMRRNIKSVSEMVQNARRHEVSEIAAVGTMCLRTAYNAQEFVAQVKEACDVTVEIISGEEEARLAYLAVKSGVGLQEGQVLIFDTGGGSTEFIFGKGEQIERRFSLNVGAVRYTEQFLCSDPVTQEEKEQAAAEIEKGLAYLTFTGEIHALIGIGGGVTNLSAVKHQLHAYDPDIVHGSALGLADIERQIHLYQSKTIAERKEIVGLQPKRADVILAGALIVRAIMKKAGVDSFTVSDRGLRHGLLVDRFA